MGLVWPDFAFFRGPKIISLENGGESRKTFGDIKDAQFDALFSGILLGPWKRAILEIFAIFGPKRAFGGLVWPDSAVYRVQKSRFLKNLENGGESRKMFGDIKDAQFDALFSGILLVP